MVVAFSIDVVYISASRSKEVVKNFLLCLTDIRSPIERTSGPIGSIQIFIDPALLIKVFVEVLGVILMIIALVWMCASISD